VYVELVRGFVQNVDKYHAINYFNLALIVNFAHILLVEQQQ